ncbi:unnamed protein product, partial [Schistosoma turkestanicum]
PPIPVRGYDQTDIDLVNQIRISSRQLDTGTSCQSTDHHQHHDVELCSKVPTVLNNPTNHVYHQCFNDSE